MQNKGPRLSTGIIPILRTETATKYLLLRSFNYWDFPKGSVEKDENPFEGAQRELEEETGINQVSFPYGEVFVETPPYNHGKVARYYLGEVKSEKVEMGINPELGTPEHQEYRWVTYKEAQKLLGPRLLTVLQWAYNLVA
ncbi:RNA pyrophosphohydrolase [compost metagenome]